MKTRMILLLLIGPLFFSLSACANGFSSGPNTSSFRESSPDFSEEFLEGADIKFEGAETREVEGVGKMFFVGVRNVQKTFRFADYIQVANDAVWIVSSDIAGREIISTRTVELCAGSNLYYISVSNDAENAHYTYRVEIYRNHMFTVYFHSDGGTPCDPIEVEEGFLLDQEKVPSPTKPGYSFSGWDYNFSNPILSDVFTTASWAVAQNLLSVTSENEVKGTVEIVSGTGITLEEITVAANPNEGYAFAGWYSGETMLSSDLQYSFVMPPRDYSIEARWNAIVYWISYEMNGGVNSSLNPSTYTIEDAIDLAEPTRTGYAFQGWFDELGNKVESIPKGTTGDLSLVARWLGDQHQLSVISQDEEKGAVRIVSGSGRTGDVIQVLATPAQDYLFRGWYSSDGQKVSSENPHSFEMPNSDYSLEARFWTEAEEEEWNASHGAVPVLSEDGKTLTYGLYPQTHVNDEATIASLNAIAEPEPNGWYLLDGEYYAKQTAKPYSSDYRYDDGTAIVSGSVDWFLCEPIEWKVLSSEAGEALVVSSLLLDVRRYGDSSKNYAKSKIRQWLNSEFLGSAFHLDSSSILTATVDNSAATTDSPTNKYVCEDTQDKAFLLSYQDYNNASYGFSDGASRRCRTTDWARARGAHSVSSPEYLNNGSYFTRSPDSHNWYDVWFVDDNGTLWGGLVGVMYGTCVRPALRVKVA